MNVNGTSDAVSSLKKKVKTMYTNVDKKTQGYAKVYMGAHWSDLEEKFDSKVPWGVSSTIKDPAVAVMKQSFEEGYEKLLETTKK